jgi:competence protein ComEA
VFGGVTRREVRLLVGMGVLSLTILAGARFYYAPPPPGPIIVHQPVVITPGNALVSDTGDSASGSSHEIATSTGRIDLNSASLDQIESLPGIGATKANAILKVREELGGFKSVDDLDRVPGIGEKTVERLRPFVEVPGAPDATPTPEATPASIEFAAEPAAPKIEKTGIVGINTAGVNDLQRLSGVGPKLADAIIADRIRRGRFKTVDDLARVKGVGPALLQKNRHRITLD